MTFDLDSHRVHFYTSCMDCGAIKEISPSSPSGGGRNTLRENKRKRCSVFSPPLFQQDAAVKKKKRERKNQKPSCLMSGAEIVLLECHCGCCGKKLPQTLCLCWFFFVIFLKTLHRDAAATDVPFPPSRPGTRDVLRKRRMSPFRRRPLIIGYGDI